MLRDKRKRRRERERGKEKKKSSQFSKEERGKEEENKTRLVLLEGTFKGHWVQLPDNIRANQNYSMLLKALSKCLLSTDKPGAPTTSPGSLF